jgi:small subunit ribosomal protein S17
MEVNATPEGAGDEATPESSQTGRRRRLIGRVVSDKMDKTVVVEVTRTVKHGKYHKFVTRRKKYHAHDEANECKVDDTVVIQESRPLSKTKHWIVIERRTA